MNLRGRGQLCSQTLSVYGHCKAMSGNTKGPRRKVSTGTAHLTPRNQSAGLEHERRSGETFFPDHLLFDELGETFPVEGRDVFPVGYFQESVSNCLVVKLREKKN